MKNNWNNTNLISKVDRGGEEEVPEAYDLYVEDTDDDANKGIRMKSNWYEYFGILSQAEANDLLYSHLNQDDYFNLNRESDLDFSYHYVDEEKDKVCLGDYDDIMTFKLKKMGIFNLPISSQCLNFCRSFKISYKKVALIKSFITQNNFNKREIMLIWSTWRGWNSVKFK